MTYYNRQDAIPNLGQLAQPSRYECDWCHCVVIGEDVPAGWEVLPPYAGDSFLGISSTPGGHKCLRCLEIEDEEAEK